MRVAGAFPDSLAEVPVLLLEHVSKTFPGTRALIDVDLEVLPGEIHALVGANGSGKSTLIKLLAGYHKPDAGAQARFNGAGFALGHRDGDEAVHLRFVHQDLGLILELSAADNLALTAGFKTTAGGRIDWRAQRRQAREMMARLGVSIDVSAPLSEATPVQRTIVAIAAALTEWESGRGLLVLDEPTAVLPHTEVAHLMEIVREVQRLGASIVYVSHRLDEIFQIADRVTVLRDGRNVGTYLVSEIDLPKLTELMVGNGVSTNFRLGREPVTEDEPVLAVRGLTGRMVSNFDCEVRRGEILGVAGLAGSGAEEVSYLLAGVRPTLEGIGEVREGNGNWEHAGRLRHLAVPLVPADRGGEGVIADFSVGENLSLAVLDRLRSGGRRLMRGKERELVEDWIEQIEIKVPTPASPVTTLSGGNQQKVVMGRCLARGSKVLILAEPTAGVDVGTRQAIYTLIGRLADEGLSVIVTSTDTTDLIALCSRVVVLADGRVVDELTGDAIDEHSLLTSMEAGRT